MRKKMVVLFVLGILSGAVAVMMCGCNCAVGAASGLVRDAQTAWSYGKVGEENARKLDGQLNR
jgi:hypothetical protein